MEELLDGLEGTLATGPEDPHGRRPEGESDVDPDEGGGSWVRPNSGDVDPPGRATAPEPRPPGRSLDAGLGEMVGSGLSGSASGGRGLFWKRGVSRKGLICCHCRKTITDDRPFYCEYCRLGPQCRRCNGHHETGEGILRACPQRPTFASPGTEDDAEDEIEPAGEGAEHDDLDGVSTVGSYSILSMMDAVGAP